ncbi:phosphotransferase family protein [Shivajiella indica]|uniref:Phosphotransferase family protein n=1 Tax=Shivajiella indica TaxID=872115 RepID=A0ABW5B806_9BACT
MVNKEPKGVENIFPYLAGTLGLDPSSTVIIQFKGGYSNLTYLITSTDGEFVLRRPPLGLKISKAHDMVREFHVLKALEKAGYSKVPKPVLCCEDEHVIGAPFFIMEKVNGLILRNKIPEGMTLSPEFFNKLSRNTIDGLLELHNLELEDSGLGALGKPKGYVERQVVGWSERYFNAKTDELIEMETVSDWLRKHIPSNENVGFIHNDYKYDNLVLEGKDNPEIKAVLDWEMATVGDPLMDLGTSLAYWAEEGDPDILKMFNLTYPKGNFTRSEVIKYYGSKSPLKLDNMLFYYAFGLFKVGVIAQQIYKRYSLGFAQDPRFAGLIHVVRACGKMALKSIQTEKI